MDIKTIPKIKYYPGEGSLLSTKGIHLFEGEESSYWAILDIKYDIIYRYYSFGSHRQWSYLFLEEISSGFVKYSKYEWTFLNEYREALKVYKKYITLL